jgi:hypothetical protein
MAATSELGLRKCPNSRIIPRASTDCSELVRQIVDRLPPLTVGQRSRLALILTGAPPPTPGRAAARGAPRAASTAATPTAARRQTGRGPPDGRA